MYFSSDNPLKMPILKFRAFSNFPEIKHGISSRFGPQNPIWPEVQPETPDDYKVGGSNLGLPDEVILKRRGEFLEACGGNWQMRLANMVSPHQQHTSNVALVGNEAYGATLNWRNSLPNTDGLVTNLPDIPLITGHADCPPVLFFDPSKQVIGVAHSGWRGTTAKISLEVVRVMVNNFGCDPAGIIASIGPFIGPCCYTVGEPVLSMAVESFGQENAAKFIRLADNGAYFFDMGSAIQHTLLDSGLNPQNITVSGICTRCRNDIFFSYRGASPAEKGKQGNFGALIMLVK